MTIEFMVSINVSSFTHIQPKVELACASMFCFVLLFLKGLTEEKYRLLASRLLVGRPRWKLLFDEIGRTNKR